MSGDSKKKNKNKARGISRAVTIAGPKQTATNDGQQSVQRIETRRLGLQAIAEEKRQSQKRYVELIAGT